jgi:hypothetical protein
MTQFSLRRSEDNGGHKWETKITGLGLMASNCKRKQGSSWSAAPVEEEEAEKDDEDYDCCTVA